MNALIQILAKSGLLTKDLDYHLLRASMVLIFLAFGYQKWFAYEAQVLIPYISNGPLIYWMYPVFGVRGASWFLGAANACLTGQQDNLAFAVLCSGPASQQDFAFFFTSNEFDRAGRM